MTHELALSMLLAALAYAALNIGLALQKQGAASLPPLESRSPLASLRAFFGCRAWLLGFGLVNLQMLPLAAAMALGPLSVVTPMLGVGLMALALFARRYLQEPITRPMYAGLLLAGAGVALFGALGAPPPAPLTWLAARALVAAPGAWLGVALLVAGVLGPLALARGLRWRLADALLGLASGCASALGFVALKLLAAAAGELGLAGAARSGAAWGVALALLGANTASMILQQLGFQKGRAVVLAPIFNAVCLLAPALIGVALLGEWDGAPAPLLAARGLAIGLITAGVAVLAAGGAAQAPYSSGAIPNESRKR